MTDLTTADAIDRLQAAMLEHPQVELETGHLFHHGTYCRMLWRPAGCLIVGKRHLKDHVYIVLSGTVRIGQDEHTGPKLIPCKAGTKRAVYAVTDALCVTFHETDATDVEAAEADLVEPDETSPFLPGNRLPVKEIAQ